MLGKIIALARRNKALKKLIQVLVFPSHDPRPRWWVRNLLNPFFVKRGKNTIIRSKARLDILPTNCFSIGNDSTIEDFSTINNAVGNVIIGDSSFIGLGNTLIGPILMGNNVMTAQNVVFSGLNHTFRDVTLPSWKQPVTTKTIVIEDEVWVGANVVITAGVAIGKHAVVAAGSVVTKDVPPYTIVGGNPAKVIKQYNFESKIWERLI
jgi:acetyltransferase-like isoleucine patch superfamily enzyme